MFDQRSLVCRSCGLSRQSRSDKSGVLLTFSRGPGPINDPYFQVPLWLQTETRHGRIWAYNPEHLEIIRQFVAHVVAGGRAAVLRAGWPSLAWL